MENKVEVKKCKKDTIISVLKVVGNVVFYAVIVTLLLFSIMNINAGSKNGGFPHIFGKGFLSVQTNSMTRSGDSLDELYKDYEIGGFAQGDLLLANEIGRAHV